MAPEENQGWLALAGRNDGKKRHQVGIVPGADSAGGIESRRRIEAVLALDVIGRATELPVSISVRSNHHIVERLWIRL